MGEAFRPAVDERATPERLAREYGYDNAALSAALDARAYRRAWRSRRPYDRALVLWALTESAGDILGPPEIVHG